jgi:hypothetical protein
MVSDPSDSTEHNVAERRVTEGRGPDFAETEVSLSAESTSGDKGTLGDPARRKRVRDRERQQFSTEEDDAGIPHTAPNIYPSKAVSRMLCLWNIFFPFKHFKFALALGVLYLMFYWMGVQINQTANDGAPYYGWFPATETLPDGTERPTHVLTQDGRTNTMQTLWFGFLASQASIPFFVLVMALWVGLVKYVDTSPFKSNFVSSVVRVSFGTLHFLAHVIAIGNLAVFVAITTYGLGGFGGWLVEMSGADAVALAQGQKDAHAISRLFAPVLMIPIGGIVAGLIWGMYWVITSMLFSMHAGDAFGALGLRHYKHFLRMRFEPDRVTIYPICIDKVPGRKGWRAATAGDSHLTHNPLLVPVKPLAPRLIEPPIVIKAEDVMR